MDSNYNIKLIIIYFIASVPINCVDELFHVLICCSVFEFFIAKVLIFSK